MMVKQDPDVSLHSSVLKTLNLAPVFIRLLAAAVQYSTWSLFEPNTDLYVMASIRRLASAIMSLLSSHTCMNNTANMCLH